MIHATAAAYAVICLFLVAIALHRAHIAGPEMASSLRVAHMIPGWLGFFGLSRIVLERGAPMSKSDLVFLALVLAGEGARMLAKRGGGHA